MIKKVVKAARKLVVADHSIVVIRTHNEGVFIVNKSYFDGEKPSRLVASNAIKWRKRLMKSVFSVHFEEVTFEAVRGKGLSYKTYFLVCDTPPHFSLNRALHLKAHVVSLDVLRASKPRHADLIEDVCRDADLVKEKVAAQAA